MKMEQKETYTFEQASAEALKWCENNKGWRRICDIENRDDFYLKWHELPKKEKEVWEKEFPTCAESAWLEFGRAKCKVQNGFVTGKGEFFEDVLEVPLHHNLMKVFKIE